MVPPATAQSEIKAILDSAVAPLLKERGYRRSGNNWRKKEECITKILNVQLSQFNSADEAKFTINLGAYHEAFHVSRGTVKPANDVKEYDCDIRLRIGRLMGAGDHWWIVAWNKDNAKVRAGVRYNIENVALPWLDAIVGLPSFLQFFQERSMHFDAAVAAHLLGRPEVPNLLSAAVASANPYFRRTVEDWAKTHEYTIPA